MFHGFYNGYSGTERHAMSIACPAPRTPLHGNVSETCEICGQVRPDVEPHAEDYSRPFIPSPYFICRTCHRRRLHMRFHHPEAWNAFVSATLKARTDLAGKKPILWWANLPVSPRAKWGFDFRPRATSDIAMALRTIDPACNPLHDRVLATLAKPGSLPWTFKEIALASEFVDASEFEKALYDLATQFAVFLGYQAPSSGDGKQVPILILATPEHITTELPFRFSADHAWRTNRSLVEGYTEYLSQRTGPRSGGNWKPEMRVEIVSDNRGLPDTMPVRRGPAALALTPDTSPPNVDAASVLQDRVREYVQASLATNTKNAYARAWRAFQTWCGVQGYAALPAAPKTVSAYLADKASSLKVTTLSLTLSAIRHAHRVAGHSLDIAHPEVSAVFAGIRRTHLKRPRRVAPLPLDALKQLASILRDAGDPRSIRDRAILLVGFCAALRRSEIVALRVQDIEFVPEGMTIRLVRRKTDQEGMGTLIGVPKGQSLATCPVSAVRDWLQRIQDPKAADPLFCSISKSGRVSLRKLDGRDIARVIQKSVALLSLDATVFSGHSLRAGFATGAAARGVPERNIMAQTGHKSVSMVRAYIRLGELFVQNPVKSFGL